MTQQSTTNIVTVAWRRLDLPGQDQARLRREPRTWHLEGQADFQDGSVHWKLSYAVVCALDWTTLSAEVHGGRDGARIDVILARSTSGRWSLNGLDVPAVTGCSDVDLAFTPATNLLALRGLDLAVGQAAEVTAAWLTFPEFALTPLRQRYRRTSQTVYAYAAPDHGFAEALTVSSEGFVLDYPGLWRAESRPDMSLPPKRVSHHG